VSVDHAVEPNCSFGNTLAASPSGSRFYRVELEPAAHKFFENKILAKHEKKKCAPLPAQI